MERAPSLQRTLPGWLPLTYDPIFKLNLSIPDVFLYDDKGRVRFVFEYLGRDVFSLYFQQNYHFSAALHFSQLKMQERADTEAEEQVDLAIFGNWREGVSAMGEATCLGSVVSN